MIGTEPLSVSCWSLLRREVRAIRRLSILTGLLLALCVAPLHSQDAVAPTLHVYSNLIQIPVLIPLGMKGALDLKYAVSLDSGPPFPITRVRLEGDDPITFAILLDLSGDQSDLVPHLNDAIASLARGPLGPRDHVSIYAVDCQLAEFAEDLATDPTRLKGAVDAAIQSPGVHGPGQTRPACGKSLHLWDALTYLTSKLAGSSGRRVVLAITDGHDSGSTHKWAELKTYANYSGVTIFGIASSQNASADPQSNNFGYEDEFGAVCQLSGGEILRADKRTVVSSLQRFVSDLHKRVIIEFPRPDALTPHPHSILVTAVNSVGFKVPTRLFRPSGFSVPIADAAVLNDPSTVPNDPSNAPVVGKRGILKSPR